MVELVINRLENLFDVSKIHDPAGMWVYYSGNMDFHIKRMPMQAATFVPGSDIGQAVSCFETEFFEDFHDVFLMDTLSRRVYGKAGLNTK